MGVKETKVLLAVFSRLKHMLMILIPYRRGNRQQGITDASCEWKAPRKRRQRRPAICWNRLSQFSTSCRLLLSFRAAKRKHGSLDIPVVRLEEAAEILNEELMKENEEDILRKWYSTICS